MKTQTHNQKRRAFVNPKGFALLFTVLIITLILTITVGISSTTFKQGILSGLARDSQTAFYQADRLLECALSYHTQRETGLYAVEQTGFTCGAETFRNTAHMGASGGMMYFTRTNTQTLGPCAVVRVIPKSSTTLDNTASLQVSGYNICQTHPRQVERTLLVTF